MSAQPISFDLKDAKPVAQQPIHFDLSDARPVTETAQPVPKIEGTLSANKQPEGWFDQAEHDLRQGGNRTIVGRGLGYLQGRGDKGYTGLESGVSKSAADTLGSPELGALHVAQGYATNRPLKVAQGALEASTLPGMVAAPEAAEAGTRAIPSAKHGGQVLNEIEHAAGGVPVNLKNSGNAISRALQLDEAGHQAPPVIKKLVARYTNPNRPDLTYSEARDFISKISKLTVEEKKSTSPQMKKQIAIVAETLQRDIADAAAQVGESARYYASVKEFARAKRLASVANAMMRTLVRYGFKGALGAAGAGAAGAIGYEMAKGALKPAAKVMPGKKDEADLEALPGPIQDALGNAKISQGPPTSTYSGMKDIATVEQGDDRNIVVRDPKRMQPQVLAHEATHLWQSGLAPDVRAKFPADNPQKPYLDVKDLYSLPKMRKQGMTLADMPEEHQAQIMQAIAQYADDPKMQKILKPWKEDAEKMRLSNILPTSPEQRGINTTPRAPQVPYGALPQ